jgi:hypothetical protein
LVRPNSARRLVRTSVVAALKLAGQTQPATEGGRQAGARVGARWRASRVLGGPLLWLSRRAFARMRRSGERALSPRLDLE